MRRLIPLFLCIIFIAGPLIPAVASGSYSGASSWAEAELERAEGYGLIPDSVRGDFSLPITREEFAETVVKLYETYMGRNARTGNASFTDTTNPEVLKAAYLGIVTGVGGELFAPKAQVTREQMASMILRTLKLLKPNDDYSISNVTRFTDDSKISIWAVEGVYYSAGKGIIKGVGEGRFDPAGNCSRQAAVIVSTRTYEFLNGIAISTPVPTATPAPENLSVSSETGIRLSAGENYSLAILEDDSLWGWGFDNGVHFGLRFSHDGQGFVYEPAKIMDDAKWACAGWGTSLVIKNDNSLWAWGDNMPSVGEDRLPFSLLPEKVMDNVISAASGGWYVLAVKSDGSLWVWGDNKGPRFNNSLKKTDGKQWFMTPVLKPTKFMDGVKKVVANSDAYCILKTDGTLLNYGNSVSSSKKQTYNGMEFDVLATGVKDMSMSAGEVYFIKSDDSLWGVGDKVYADYSPDTYDDNKSSSYDYTPVKVRSNVRVAGSSSAYYPMAVDKDGKMVVWSSETLLNTFFSNNKQFTLEGMKTPKVLELMSGVTNMSAGDYQCLAAKSDGTVWAWGIIGDGSNNNNTFGSSQFVKLEFDEGNGTILTNGSQPDKLLSKHVEDMVATGSMPAYNGTYKPNWNADYWEETGYEMKGFHTVQSGNTVYGYDLWDTLCLVGTIDGNRLKGSIFEGVFEIRLSADGKSFTGMTYLNSASEPAVWTGIRK